MSDAPAPVPAPARAAGWQLAGISLGLGLLTVLTFYGVWKNDFVDFDDNLYVLLNPNVRRGLDWGTVTWAFSQTHACNWHPVTWLSHALDCQIYGLRPAGHHVTSLVFHTANAVLLFLVLRRMTGSLWPCALAAALFAVHPLHVESVAWVAERKDVLSGFFFMLTLLAYARYVSSFEKHSATEDSSPRDQRSGNSTLKARFWYGAALGFFALGLMSKPMLVTLPCVLLLLDYWPLRRFQFSSPNLVLPPLLRLTREKLPFFVLVLISSIITVLAQETAVMDVSARAPSARLANAGLAYVAYLQQTFCPINLSVFYPGASPLIQTGTALAFGLLVAASLAALLLARKLPFVPTGWFWYLGMLVPVIGLVQVGSQGQADRYTYLPSIGIFIVIAWGLAGIVAVQPNLKLAFGTTAALGIVALALAAHRQVSVWRNTQSLFTHAVSVTPNNFVALTSLAKCEMEQGHLDAATANLDRALQIAPGFPTAEYLMASVLQMQGRMQEALPHLEAVTGGPEMMIPCKARLVLTFLDAGRLTEAGAALDELFRVAPGSPDVLLMKAALLKDQGRTSESDQLFRAVAAQGPIPAADNPTLNFQLGELYSQAGENRKALPYYSKAIEVSPRFTNALNNFAWILGTDPDHEVRNGPRAVELAERACQLTEWKLPLFIGTLAAAYAEAGRFDDAVKMAERARDLARADNLEAIAQRNEELLKLYRQRKPYRAGN